MKWKCRTCLPTDSIKSRVAAQRGEIERAIDDVKRGCRCSPARVQKDLMRRITIIGKAPPAFFAWFEERQQMDWKHREMLSNCFFEERFGGAAAGGPESRRGSSNWRH